MQTEQIKSMLAEGHSIEEIAEGFGVSELEVKSLVKNNSIDITTEEEIECKEVLLAYARGQVANQSQDHQITSAKYIHKVAVEARKEGGGGRYQRTIEVLGALKTKALERSRQYEEAIPA